MAIDALKDVRAMSVQLAFEVGSVLTPGAPINDRELFAGRIGQIRDILSAVSQRGYHAVLFGERGVGKTSLSNVLAGLLRDTGVTGHLLSRVNCDASDDYSSLWRKALRDIIVIKSRPGIGFTADQIEVSQSIVDALPDVLAPDEVRRVLTNLAQGVILVVVFDEFDRIQSNVVTTTMADTIKMLSDYSVPATILLIGVADSVNELIKEHQSIERAVVQVPMPRMSDDEVREIISKGLDRLKMTIESDALDHMVSLSQGIPYITHLIALHTARTAAEADMTKITSDHLSIGIERALDQWQQSIKSAYYEATKSPQPGHIYKQVLLACALAEVDDLRYFTAAAVRKPLRIITGRQYEIPNFAKHLKEFSNPARGQILQRTGEKRRIRYRFASPILRPYIIMRGFGDKIITKTMLKKIAHEP
jgi:Holliday junction resolvasome RuvABC ATP-dependent DNA helicase subunit